MPDNSTSQWPEKSDTGSDAVPPAAGSLQVPPLQLKGKGKSGWKDSFHSLAPPNGRRMLDSVFVNNISSLNPFADPIEHLITSPSVPHSSSTSPASNNQNGSATRSPHKSSKKHIMHQSNASSLQTDNSSSPNSPPRVPMPVMSRTRSTRSTRSGHSSTPLKMPLENTSSHSSLSEAETIPPPALTDSSAANSPRSFLEGLRGLGIDKVPASRRPTDPNLDNVRDMDARTSSASLTDLIKRATRVASKMDRNTAGSRLTGFSGLSRLSRVGKPGGFTSPDKRSSLSDMISSFPAPSTRVTTPRLGTPRSTPRLGTPRQESLRPRGEKAIGAESSTLEIPPPKAKRRRCCGLPLPVAITALTILILLILAAILLPILLIAVPRLHKSSNLTLAQCMKSSQCLNGGTSAVVNGNCACVCTGGYSGQNCDTSIGVVDCASATLTDGSTTYTNITIGTMVESVFQEAVHFNIPLNASIILATFSSNDLSCSGENTLVNLNATAASYVRRFIRPDVAARQQEPETVSSVVVPSTTTALTTLIKAVRVARSPRVVDESLNNGVVFEASSTSDGEDSRSITTSNGEDVTATASSDDSSSTSDITTHAVDKTATSIQARETTSFADESSSTTADSSASTVTAAVTATNTTASTTTSSTPTSSPTWKSATQEQQNFAQVVVLYALQESYTVAFAANAQQSMRLFFSGVSSSGNGTVQVGTDALPLTVDFDKLSITNSGGVVVGGTG